MKSFGEFINEAPYVTDETPDVLDNSFGETSTNTLNTEYDFLFKTNNVSIYIRKTRDGIILRGVIFNKSKERHPIVFVLKAENKLTDYILRLQLKNPIQVRNVQVSDEYTRGGLAHTVYKKLVDIGYTVVSDRVQLVGGMELWKKFLATNNNVKVWNSKKHAYVDEKDINIIWTSGDDSTGRNYLLVMAK